MRLLLDTHAYIWLRVEPARVPPKTRSSVAEADLVLVSAVSGWEIELKVASGKLRPIGTFGDGMRDSGYVELPVYGRHVDALRELPQHHHRDPFDRMLVAQARAEGATLVTADRDIRAYAVPTMWE